jgi:hypothetical protein
MVSLTIDEANFLKDLRLTPEWIENEIRGALKRGIKDKAGVLCYVHGSHRQLGILLPSPVRFDNTSNSERTRLLGEIIGRIYDGLLEVK